MEAWRSVKAMAAGDSLLSIRAAVEVVARRAARRITLRVAFAEQILPAARAIGRASGVTVEPAWRAGHLGCDIVISAATSVDGCPRRPT